MKKVLLDTSGHYPFQEKIVWVTEEEWEIIVRHDFYLTNTEEGRELANRLTERGAAERLPPSVTVYQ